ncbi:MAG: hypothetical protein ACR2LV_02805 [Solirubrobacteraceae bacterium]
MSTPSSTDAAGGRMEMRLAAILCALGALTVAVPYLGHAIGLGVNVDAKLEIVDHVVPGTLVAAIGGSLFLLVRRGQPVAEWVMQVGSGICFLAGIWVLATHVPLLADAAGGSAHWGAALWHASTALPVVVISLWYVLRGPAGPDQI